MTRRPSVRLAVGLLALLAPAGLLAACGGDDDDAASSPSAATDEAATDEAADASATAQTVLDGDVEDISIPEGAGLSEECAAIYQRFILAMGATTTGENPGDLGDAFASLEGVVPDELDDDVRILSEAYGELAEVIADFDGDMAAAMADPDTQERMNAIGTPEVTAAGDAISEYFEEACPEAT